MQETIQILTILIAALGSITGTLSLYLHYKEIKANKVVLAAWVLSASYIFKNSIEESNLELMVNLVIQNSGGKPTTISHAFAEVHVGKKLPTTYSAEGKMVTQQANGEPVSGSVNMAAGDSKNIRIDFVIQSVNPMQVERYWQTLMRGQDVLEAPIKVDFLIRHTDGSLKGTWAVYDTHQELMQSVASFLSQQSVSAGKPHWVSK